MPVGLRAALFLMIVLAGCNGSRAGHTTPVTGTPATLTPASGATLPATVGLVYSQTFTVASGGGAPYTLTVTGAPTGLSLAPTTPSGTAFVLQGTPTVAGPFSPQFHVVDALSFSTFLTYQLDVQNGGSSIPIAPSSLPAANVNQPYNQTLTALAGVPSFSWTIGTGALPPGLILLPGPNATTTISGTPQFSGTFTFTVAVTDGSNPKLKGGTFYALTVN